MDKDYIAGIELKNMKSEIRKTSNAEVEKATKEHSSKMEAYFAEVAKVRESPERAPAPSLF